MGRRRVAIVARTGRIDHYERLSARRHPWLEPFRLFVSRSRCRPPGDFRGRAAKPFRDVDDREDDEPAHGGMNKLRGSNGSCGRLDGGRASRCTKTPRRDGPNSRHWDTRGDTQEKRRTRGCAGIQGNDLERLVITSLLLYRTQSDMFP